MTSSKIVTRFLKKPFVTPQTTRSYSSPSTPLSSPFALRHLLSISDLSSAELHTLVRNAFIHKQAARSGRSRLWDALQSQTVALMFTKRSTRTRVSTEAAIAAMGGHAMFLGQNDIQLGVYIDCFFQNSRSHNDLIFGL